MRAVWQTAETAEVMPKRCHQITGVAVETTAAPPAPIAEEARRAPPLIPEPAGDFGHTSRPLSSRPAISATAAVPRVENSPISQEVMADCSTPSGAAARRLAHAGRNNADHAQPGASWTRPCRCGVEAGDRNSAGNMWVCASGRRACSMALEVSAMPVWRAAAVAAQGTGVSATSSFLRAKGLLRQCAEDPRCHGIFSKSPP